jgi:hypothetical protein
MMDDNYVILIVVVACVAAVHQFIAASSILFVDAPTVREKRLLSFIVIIKYYDKVIVSINCSMTNYFLVRQAIHIFTYPKYLNIRVFKTLIILKLLYEL